MVDDVAATEATASGGVVEHADEDSSTLTLLLGQADSGTTFVKLSKISLLNSQFNLIPSLLVFLSGSRSFS